MGRRIWRVLNALPFDGWGLGAEAVAEAGRLRRYLTRVQLGRFPLPVRPLAALGLRSLWLCWSPLAARWIGLRGARWRRAVQRAWLHGHHPVEPEGGVSLGNLPDRHWARLWPALGAPEDVRLAADKLALARVLEGLGVRVPPLLAEIPQGARPHPADLPWQQDSRPLFIKPRHGARARDAMSLRQLGGGHLLVNGAEAVTEQAVAERLARSAARDSLLVQPFLRPMPESRRWAPESCAELRLTTARLPGGPSFLVGAFMKVQPPGDHTATTLRGALAVPVDMASGRARPGFLATAPEQRLDHVPWTGAPLAGQDIPAFHQAVETVLQASRALPGLPVIGWDVLLAEGGPVVLEANVALSWDMIHWSHPTDEPSPLVAVVMNWVEMRERRRTLAG